MHHQSFAVAANQDYAPKKRIAPWLKVAADIHEQYILRDTTLTIEQIRKEIFYKHDNLPFRELAAILGLFEQQFAEKQAKRVH